MSTVERKGYEPALKEALNNLRDIDLEYQCRVCRARYDEERSCAVVPFLGQEYRAGLADGEVYGADGPVPVIRRLIILHYLMRSNGTRPSGNMITFREVPEGKFYFASFYDRALRPFLAAFGRTPDVLRERGMKAGWRRCNVGDVCLETNALPLVPIRLVLWCGDEELTPEASMLFDSTVSEHLHTEDIALLAEEVVNGVIMLEDL